MQRSRVMRETEGTEGKDGERSIMEGGREEKLRKGHWGAGAKVCESERERA